jgi:hypothetical protein
VFVYADVIDGLHPNCGRPERPAITFEEALAATMTHELGHTLQLGHDTDTNGGKNCYNIMSVPSSCDEAHQRVRGLGNSDDRLGNTEAISAPRFSEDAIDIMKLDAILSVDTALDSARDM